MDNVEHTTQNTENTDTSQVIIQRLLGNAIEIPKNTHDTLTRTEINQKAKRLLNNDNLPICRSTGVRAPTATITAVQAQQEGASDRALDENRATGRPNRVSSEIHTTPGMSRPIRDDMERHSILRDRADNHHERHDRYDTDNDEAENHNTQNINISPNRNDIQINNNNDRHPLAFVAERRMIDEPRDAPRMPEYYRQWRRNSEEHSDDYDYDTDSNYRYRRDRDERRYYQSPERIDRRPRYRSPARYSRRTRTPSPRYSRERDRRGRRQHSSERDHYHHSDERRHRRRRESPSHRRNNRSRILSGQSIDDDSDSSNDRRSACKTLKSGISAKPTSSVKVQLKYPHFSLGQSSCFIGQNLHFHQLNFDQFVAGEMITINNCVDDTFLWFTLTFNLDLQLRGIQ